MNITLKGVWWSYCKAIVSSFILVVIAYKLALFINSYNCLSSTHIAWMQNISIIPVAAALYGQFGNEIQTYGAKTTVEYWNNLIFKILSSLGFFLSVLAFHLKA